jgi:D-alanyl-D-alanine carboxypeptidase/D-alanyl-D-alanine-endopeptidase (penicillin-binding protein 4)
MKKMLAAAGVLEEEFDLRDGSGLSRLDLVTPAATVKLLRHLWDSPHRETWIATLPVGGLDGTLENRFQFPRSGRGRWPSPGVIQAKTGTLSHVATLSGYLRSKTWGPVAFSVMVNQFTARSAEIRAAIDRICLEIAK